MPALRLDSEARGDLYSSINLRTAMTPFLALVDDDPARSRYEAEDAIGSWSRQGFHVQHCNALFAHVQAALYEGAAVEARERLERDWPALQQSMLLQVQQIRVRAVYFRACARAAVGDIRGARDDMRRLEREEVGWSHALALLVRAALEGTERSMATLRAAIIELQACDLGLYADAAKHRLAVLGAHASDTQAVRDANAALRARGIQDPVRMTDMLVPQVSHGSIAS